MKSYSLQKATDKLSEIWGYSSFRQGQDKAIASILEGNTTFVLFPTGGGKSLCYQVPALVFDRLTIVISPLVALMQDQVQQLKERGVSAAFINSSLNRKQVEQVLLNARNNLYKLLYCSPERLHTQLFQEYLPELNVEFVAIDEAHCISEWGHEFRPSYRHIRSSFENQSENIRWMALTATATPEVQADILKNLEFENAEVIKNSFSRSNLHWWVNHSENKKEKLVASIQKAQSLGSGLIYSNSRRDCELYAEILNKEKIKTEAYHAGMDAVQRADIQQRWITNETPLVVSTSAFGMGIDKSDCRYVFHKDHPHSLEAYYQEAGRAGRDGEDAYPVLFVKKSDFAQSKKRLEERYPEVNDLQKVYDVLCDELSISLNAVNEDFHLLDVEKLKQRSKIASKKIYVILDILQKHNVIEIIESKEEKIGIHFALNRESLFERVNDQREKAEFVDQLMRYFGDEALQAMHYLGINDLLAKLQITRNSLLKALNVLSKNDGLLLYAHLEEAKEVKVLSARSKNIPVDIKQIEKQRNVLINKLDKVHQYVETTNCREVFLRAYFGDFDAKPCGKCDNCLTRIESESLIDPIQFQKIIEALKDKPISSTDISKQFKVSRKAADEVLHHFTKEGNIEKVEEGGQKYRWKS